MPMSSENELRQGSEILSNPSVYDFLYNDSRRVASYLAQFEGGHLTQLTRTAETGSSTSEQSGRDFTIGMTRVLGGGSKSSESEAVSAKDALVRTFDPYWTNARAFLDYLSERGLIERDIAVARMGQFVLVQGKLAILNLAAMQSVWDMPLFKKLLGEEMDKEEPVTSLNRQQKMGQAKKGIPDPFAGQPTIVRLAIEMLPTFPHSTVASMIGNDWSTWSTLNTENLVGSAADLMLKHGNRIAGDWAMLGVLDAAPDSDETVADDQIVAASFGGNSAVAQATLGLTPVVRMMAGRPDHAFGITPLLIFREIAA